MVRKDEAEQGRRPKIQTVIMVLVVVIPIALAGWALVTVGTTSQIPPSDFVLLPTTPLSTKGNETIFVRVSAVPHEGVAVGVMGYVQTSSGSPVAGARVYITYFLQGAYRTQAATTDQKGYFQARFPMNWTGWLPVTLTYFGDDQHMGVTQVFSISGESLAAE